MQLYVMGRVVFGTIDPGLAAELSANGLIVVEGRPLWESGLEQLRLKRLARAI
jgi:hypothetical protein